MNDKNLGERVEKLEEIVESLEERIESLESKLDVADIEKVREKKSWEEFKKNYSPDSHHDKITLIGYYYENYTDKEAFSKTDIKEGYKKCRWSHPSSLKVTISQTSSKGYIMGYGEKSTDKAKLWILTEEGLGRVEEIRKDE